MPLAKPPANRPVSTLINDRQISYISHWIDGNESGNIIIINYNFLLLSEGSWDSMTKTKFHSLCDNIEPTLILARIDNTNDIIDGYNPNSWTSTNQWIITTESFIFSFKYDGNKKGW
jgi:hypothetical protein